VVSIIEEELLLEQVSLKVTALSAEGRQPLISVDGLGGTGKTTIAMKIAEVCRGKLISVDDYLIPRQGSYLAHIRYNELARDIGIARKSPDTPVVVEGLCIRGVLRTLGEIADVTVYVRRVDEFGRWTDEHFCSEENDLDEVLEELGRFESLPGIGDQDREAARYHIEEKPISRADFVYDRVRRPPSIDSASA